ncbi:hypothetical protein V5G24_23270 [Xanthobacter sp. VTT E-85241]|uniref:hypothetical protein n=1 Tax=Roseixanthobacter finlandensis TaxID=3119922 RepID=UPI00372814EF
MTKAIFGELTNTLFFLGVSKVYGDLAGAAKKKRLTESDIGDVERIALIDLSKARAAIPEFPDGGEEAIEAAEALLREFFHAAKQARRGGKT